MGMNILLIRLDHLKFHIVSKGKEISIKTVESHMIGVGVILKFNI